MSKPGKRVSDELPERRGSLAGPLTREGTQDWNGRTTNLRHSVSPELRIWESEIHVN